VESQPGSLAEYFDGWYADMIASPVKDEIQQRHLGLPPHLLSTSECPPGCGRLTCAPG
jgi:hypothetical protein